MTSRHKGNRSPDPCDQLQPILLGAEPACLERLAQSALGNLLDVPFRSARAGDQRGGDGGASGTRDLVFEARRYEPTTSFDERGIRGQILQAIERKSDLEVWILVSTREVPEQVQDAIDTTALGQGIAAFSIDWLRQPLPRLAVLSASDPDGFAAEFGQQHNVLLERIRDLPEYTPTLKSIERELQSWSIGYESLREASHRRVREIWEFRRRAQAKFKQDVAGGEESARHVRRTALIDRLDAWFDCSHEGAIGALVGRDGAGKTWATVDWLQLRLDRLPIVVLAPSSALGSTDPTRDGLVKFVAHYLREVAEARDVSYWEGRVRRLLERPVDEGQTLLLFCDGLNQLPSYDWPGLLQQLEDRPFHRRVVTLISTRTTFFDDQLDGLRRLIAPPDRIVVGNYDEAPCSEFDWKLALAGFSRNDLPEHLVRHAVVPRMFDLIVRLRSELGGVREVTVHRLLWAYGASTIPASSDGAFSEREWRCFLRDLAGEYRDGRSRSTRRQVESLSASATLTPDHVYRRVSGVVDGIFTRLDRDGDLNFESEFVYHALGLALVSRMERHEAGEDPTTVLDQFLDPISGYDGRAEVMRAAVSITLLRHDAEPPTWLGALCTCWLHSQNLPEGHRDELGILAPELVTPMLDVVEASCGHPLTTPREIAISALAAVDKSDPHVAAVIAERAARWQGRISLEMRENQSDRTNDSFHTHRCKRLMDRIGVVEPGAVTVAGREFEIVERTGDDLIVAAAQLLQGRPLNDAIEFFVRGAIQVAVVGGGAAQETQSWLNMLNTVDPEATAIELRRASQMIRSITPEDGHHPDLNARIASLLLWRTGYSDDAAEAWNTDPKIDHHHRYETDYLSDPSRSFFRLERRHAAQVLCDKSLPMFRRIERAKDALLDPTFAIPPGFVDELTAVSDEFDFSRTATSRWRSSEDMQWDHLSLALARCAPGRLASRDRARIQQFAERSADQRLGPALVAPELMLLVGRSERVALRTLRERGTGESGRDENTIRTNLLIAEIQADSPVGQVTKILNSDLDPLNLYLSRACQTPSRGELDRMIAHCGEDERMLSRLAILLGEHDLELSERAFDAFLGLLVCDRTDISSGAAWVLLASNDAERLGTVLDRTDWSWSRSRPNIENIMGSKAISASNRGSVFCDLAARIAPARLLAALSEDQRSRDEVAFAVGLLSAALAEYPEDAPKSGLDISHDEEVSATGNYEFTIGDIVEERDNENDILSFVERNNHPERHAQRRRAIIQSYVDAVREARRSGAQLLHAHFAAQDFDIVLDLYPEALDTWLEGMESTSAEFHRRVRLAEGFFVALCEAVLRRNPSRGIALWRALRQCVTIGFISRTGIDRLKFAPFAAGDCPAANVALDELYGLDESRTDEDLFDIVVAARSSARDDWLHRVVSHDDDSPCPAHRRRAAFLRPLLNRPGIAGDAAWPSGASAGGNDAIGINSWIMAQRESFAAHWLQSFAEADTPESSHATWCLYMACCDRRARSWMSEGYGRYAVRTGPTEALKLRFITQHRYRLDRAITDNEKSLEGKFTTQRIANALLPWNLR